MTLEYLIAFCVFLAAGGLGSYVMHRYINSERYSLRTTYVLQLISSSLLLGVVMYFSIKWIIEFTGSVG